MNLSEFKEQGALVRDDPRILQGLGNLSEVVFHLLGRLEVEFIGGKTKPVLVLKLLAGLDAEEDFVRQVVGLLQVVAIVCCHDVDLEFLCEADEAAVCL